MNYLVEWMTHNSGAYSRTFAGHAWLHCSVSFRQCLETIYVCKDNHFGAHEHVRTCLTHAISLHVFINNFECFTLRSYLTSVHTWCLLKAMVFHNSIKNLHSLSRPNRVPIRIEWFTRRGMCKRFWSTLDCVGFVCYPSLTSQVRAIARAVMGKHIICYTCSSTGQTLWQWKNRRCATGFVVLSLVIQKQSRDSVTTS